MSNNKLKIVNDFGITPKTSFIAAGIDFFIPKLASLEPDKQIMAYHSFGKSFNMTDKELDKLRKTIYDVLCTKISNYDLIHKILFDVIHLYLALDNKFQRSDKCTLMEKVTHFIEYNLTFKDQETVGIKLDEADQLKINSGIKEALPHDYAGIFFNKSGRGNDGLDVMSCVIDEDYTGYVHLSVINSKKTSYKVYCGEKLVQQVILPIYQVSQIEEINNDDYQEIMKGSQRGDGGFCSTGV